MSVPPGYSENEIDKIYNYHPPDAAQAAAAQAVANLCREFRQDLEALLVVAPNSGWAFERQRALDLVREVCEQAMLHVLRPPVYLGAPPGHDDRRA